MKRRLFICKWQCKISVKFFASAGFWGNGRFLFEKFYLLLSKQIFNFRHKKLESMRQAGGRAMSIQLIDSPHGCHEHHGAQNEN
jgi:hypothetical protein